MIEYLKAFYSLNKLIFNLRKRAEGPIDTGPLAFSGAIIFQAAVISHISYSVVREVILCKILQ